MACGAVRIRGGVGHGQRLSRDVSEKFVADRAAWGNRGSGIVCIAYDVQDAKDERDTRNIYVAVSLRVRKICSLATTMVKVGSRLGDSQCSTAPRIWS